MEVITNYRYACFKHGPFFFFGGGGGGGGGGWGGGGDILVSRYFTSNQTICDRQYEIVNRRCMAVMSLSVRTCTDLTK